MAVLARSAKVSCAASAASTRAVASVRPVAFGAQLPRRAAVAAPQRRAESVVAQVSPVEVAQVAGEAGFIAGTALTMVAMTLVGLACGFVLLRVESLTEEGKL